MKNILRTITIASCALVLLACNKQPGASSFALPQDLGTLIFRGGESKSFSHIGENIKVCTAKPPKGWYATVTDNVITVVAPQSDGTYSASGNVDVYARGYDNIEYVVKVPVRTEARLNKTQWTLVYASSEEPMNYSSQNFTREDDHTSSMTGYAKDLIDGSYSSIWAYNASKGHKVPFYFVIDLGEEKTLSAMDIYAQRANKNLSDPTNTIPFRQCGEAIIEFAGQGQVSGNGMADKGGSGQGQWRDKQSFYFDQLKNVIHNLVPFNKTIKARYIRFTYVKGYYKETDESPTYNGGALAELDLLGY